MLRVCVCVFQYVDDNLAVMSIGFLLGSPDDAVIWRGPKKNGVYLCLYHKCVFLLTQMRNPVYYFSHSSPN